MGVYYCFLLFVVVFSSRSLSKTIMSNLKTVFVVSLCFKQIFPKNYLFSDYLYVSEGLACWVI